jgi:GTP cyclohydrolase IA
VESTSTVDYQALYHIGRSLLMALGADPEQEDLVDTPRRFADWWREFIEYDPGQTETCFEQREVGQLIVVSGIRLYTICEHHLLPFWCDATIGYIAERKLLGLSKIPRIAQQYAHQLQTQERLGAQIADEIRRVTESNDVAVLLKGEHLCMVARGIRSSGSMMTLTAHGKFREVPEARAEFLALTKH